MSDSSSNVVLLEKSSLDEMEISNGTVYFHLQTHKVLEIAASTAKMMSNSAVPLVAIRSSFQDTNAEICNFRLEYSSWYLTIIVLLVTVGLTASLFILTIIGWFPDLSSSSKHVCQAYALLSNMVSILAAGFVILSTFVPTANACSVSLILVHLSLFMFVSSDLLLHLDFYFAIVAPFWHEETIAASETISPVICASSIALSAIGAGALYFFGPFWCPEPNQPRSMFECPIVAIMNLTRDGSITTFMNMVVVGLFSLVLASSCHVFIIALQKLRANSVAPATQKSKSASEDGVLPTLDPKSDQKCEVFKINMFNCRQNPAKGNAFITVQPPEMPEMPSAGNEPSSTSDSQAPLAEEGGRERESKGKGAPGKSGEELGRALTKSFRYNLINIITYVFFLLPSMGLGLEASGYQNILGPLDPILGGENGVFLAAWAWKFSLFLFMVFRTAHPIVMAKTDKALLSKINVIISDDVED